MKLLSWKKIYLINFYKIIKKLNFHHRYPLESKAIPVPEVGVYVGAGLVMNFLSFESGDDIAI
jgi:hypothetical protein